MPSYPPYSSAWFLYKPKLFYFLKIILNTRFQKLHAKFFLIIYDFDLVGSSKAKCGSQTIILFQRTATAPGGWPV